MMHRYNTRSNDRVSPKKDKLSYGLTIVEEKEEEVGYTDRDFAELIVDEVLDQYSSKYGVDLDSDKIFKMVEKTLKRSKGLSDKRELEVEETASEEEEEEEEVSSVDESAVSESETDYQSEEVDESEQEEYYEELDDAISHVKKLAKSASKDLFKRVMDEYKLETGKYPSLSELEESVDIVKETLLSDESADEEEEEEDISVRDVTSVLEFADELELALDVASKIGEMHQEYLVNEICDQFIDINGEEPELDDISDIFGRVKDALKEEAMDELLDDISADRMSDVEDDEDFESGDEDSDDDEDYRVTAEDIIQSIKDDIDLKAIESGSEEEYSEDSEVVESEEEEESYYDENEDSEDDSDYDPDYDEQDYTGDYQLYR